MKGFRLGFGALLGVFLLSNVSAWAAAGSFLVVSDIDDTVKRTDVLHKGSALAHMFVEPVFAGMPELYQGLVENSKAAGGSPVLGRSLVFLSGSPTFLRHSLKDGLEERGFPAATYVLMNWFHELNTEVFKRRIFESMASFEQLPFVLLGDDTEHDPEVLTDFAKKYPEHSLAVYIHRVSGRALPAGAIGFNTAFEVAVSEVEAGRLTVAQADRVADRVLSADVQEILPEFVQCPRDLPLPELNDSELQFKAILVRSRILSICTATAR